MKTVTIRTVASSRDLMQFIKFQWKPYRGDPNFVPPLIMDRKKLLNRKSNPFYKHAEMELFLAERDGEIFGRIAAIVNHNHIKEHNEKVGFFGFFECMNDRDVANALFGAATGWLTSRGMEAVRGPANPSVNDEYGLLIDGFDRPPVVLMTYNPPYYAALLEGYGFRKIKDLYAYYLHKDKVFSEKMVRVSEAVMKRTGLVIRPMDFARFEEEVRTMQRLYALGWRRNWGEVPMTDEEVACLTEDLKKVVDRRLLLIAEVKGKPVGFSLSLPDLNIILRRNRRGWLLPAVLRLMLFKKRIDFCRILTLGVLPEYLSTGIGGVLFYEAARHGIAAGYSQGEASWILEDNTMMNRGAEMLNADRYKTYRIYQMPLSR
jgi:GNAT superfamily N-acetyltransferase